MDDKLFKRLTRSPNGHGWYSSDGQLWDYYGNAIGRQRWLNMQVWLEQVKLDEQPQRIGQAAHNWLERAMVVAPV